MLPGTDKLLFMIVTRSLIIRHQKCRFVAHSEDYCGAAESYSWAPYLVAVCPLRFQLQSKDQTYFYWLGHRPRNRLDLKKAFPKLVSLILRRLQTNGRILPCISV